MTNVLELEKNNVMSNVSGQLPVENTATRSSGKHKKNKLKLKKKMRHRQFQYGYIWYVTD